MKNLRKKDYNHKGITLIALVITIIVLLILAGISIAMLTGNNGILTQAQRAAEETRSASVEEAKDLWKNNQSLDEATGSSTAQSLEELLQGLQNQGLLTEEEVAIVKETGSVEIVDGKPIEFGLTIGSVYTDDMIGQKVTYSSNGQSDWIIFGKDKDGNILLTTAKPIDNAYELYGSAKNWLTYENDLNAACSKYGTTIKGKKITSRSITMEDINYVSGFDISQLDFDIYTFGTKKDYANRQVNFYYPSLDAVSTDYWKKATETSDSITFENNWYGYGYMNNKFIYEYSGGGEELLNINAEKFRYVIKEEQQETAFNEYLVATCSTCIKSDGVHFSIAYVGNNLVVVNKYLCFSDSGSGNDDGELGTFGIRPIVILPYNIEVEKNESGLWDIAY